MLELINVSASYRPDCPVLKNLNFSLNTKECVGVIGPNGCGKTTLLRVLSGVLPYSGSVILDGKELREYSRYELAGKIAVLHQITGAYFPYTVKECVSIGRYTKLAGKWFKTLDRADKRIVREAMEATAVLDIADECIDSLSGGQLQRVFLARTLAQEPEIIMLDEPTNHLDLKHQIELIRYIKNWAENGRRGVIGVLHDLNLTRQLATDLLALKDGSKLFLGKARDGFEADMLEAVFGMDVQSYMKKSYELWNND